MKISKLKVHEVTTKPKNLEEIDLTRKPLGSTVALVGKNGAGKSRILDFVKYYIESNNPENLYNGHIENLPQTIIGNNQRNLDSAIKSFKQSQNDSLSEQQQRQAKQQADSQIGAINNRFQQLGKAYVKVVDNDDLKTIKAVANNNNSLSFEQILNNQHFNNLTLNQQNQRNQPQILNEFTSFNSQSTIQYLTKLTNEIATDEFNLYLKNRETPELVNPEIKKKKSYQLFSIFQDYVRKFLGKDFSYKQTVQGNTVNSTLHYNDQPFNLNLFSPGQKTLFAYAILFFYLDVNSKANLKDSILIIDEPEKHLHPEAQIDLINALKTIVSKSGQLWIATHSIHILSHLEYDEILMVENNKIIPPSRTTPGKSFNALMGLDTHISKLVTFINSISDWAYGNFMLQCFKEPDVIFDNNPDDPQFKLFKKFLSKRTNSKLLDYGAGKGRIGYTLNEDETISKKTTYSAYEPDKGHYSILNNVPNIKNTFSNSNEIPDNYFDCVLMCNVLHEINPKDWNDSFKTIKRVLKDSGYLLVIEDKFLPKGENAHQFGYLILGTDELKILLSSDNVLELKLKEEKYENRILFNAFKKEEINQAPESIYNAINKLKENSFNNLRLLRKEEKTIDQGRRYANQTQLYINAQLALEGMKK